VPWAHLDIAGSAWTLQELPYCPKGATGIGVRTLAHWLRGLAAA
jgi:leucyl aminopeptidase